MYVGLKYERVYTGERKEFNQQAPNEITCFLINKTVRVSNTGQGKDKNL